MTRLRLILVVIATWLAVAVTSPVVRADVFAYEGVQRALVEAAATTIIGGTLSESSGPSVGSVERSGSASRPSTTSLAADLATNTAGADYLRKEGQIAARFGTTVRAVKDAIHAAKTNLPKGRPIRNPDVAVDPDTGEIYPVIDGCLGDSIGNVWDLLGGD
jgi:hypothetical protein